MNAEDLHTLTGAYAADALDAEERARFEAHLQRCATCTEEVMELTATAARLAQAVATRAPAELRDRVLSQARLVPQQRPRVVGPAHSRSPRARAWYRQPLAAAAALLLVVSVGLGGLLVRADQRADEAQQLADRISAITSDPDKFSVTRQVTGGGTATVVVAGSDALFAARGLAQPADDRTYQLWVIGEQGPPRSVGLLSPRADGRVTQLVSGVSPGDAIGLTVEPSGGSKAPTTEPVLLVASPA